MTIIYRN